MHTTEAQSNEITTLDFQLPPEAREKIERAAVASGMTVTDFAIHALVSSADEVLERQHTRTLSDRDRDIFLALLDADDEPNEALQGAFEAHSKLIAK
ncbi:MAG: DUF1778 domain-containing protein [Pyrinomonadaceae bacterium MAG19_C2-C3]|nr:DUF1778 domain-containing protein [Pyrinomonadaceae bacterium MAG19_C2-C3]